MGISRDRIVADCLAESAGINPKAAETTIKTMRLVKEELGLNLCMGASNISFGLPVRSYINTVFMALVVNAGLDSAIVNVQTVRPYVLAADLVSGRDRGLADTPYTAGTSRRVKRKRSTFAVHRFRQRAFTCADKGHLGRALPAQVRYAGSRFAGLSLGEATSRF